MGRKTEKWYVYLAANLLRNFSGLFLYVPLSFSLYIWEFATCATQCLSNYLRKMTEIWPKMSIMKCQFWYPNPSSVTMSCELSLALYQKWLRLSRESRHHIHPWNNWKRIGAYSALWLPIPWCKRTRSPVTIVMIRYGLYLTIFIPKWYIHGVQH